MSLSSLPEWTLEPVMRVEPGPEVGFPRLLSHGPGGPVTIPQWLTENQPLLEEALARDGAVLLRGFDVPGEAAFEQAAQALTRTLEPRYGDLVKRPTARFVYDATWYPKDRAILFHNEGAHTPQLPTRQLFFCARDGFRGGETPIVDCRRLYQALGSSRVRDFEAKGLLYVRNFLPGVDVSWQDFFRTSDAKEVERRCREQNVDWAWKRDGSLRTVTRAPAVVRHPGSGEPSFCNQIMLHHVSCLDARTGAALRAVLDPEDLPRNVLYGDRTEIPDELVTEVLKAAVRTAVRFTWRRGDVLLLDNLAAAHARSPFEGDRQILVAVGEVTAQAGLESPQARRPGTGHPVSGGGGSASPASAAPRNLGG